MTTVYIILVKAGKLNAVSSVPFTLPSPETPAYSPSLQLTFQMKDFGPTVQPTATFNEVMSSFQKLLQ